MNLHLPPRTDHFREQAVLQDLLAADTIQLATLWRKLLDGNHRIMDSFFTPQRCYLLLESRPEPKLLLPRQRLILEHALRGVCQNAVAIDLELAPSTVATQMRDALKNIGLDSKPSRCHPLPMLAAIAAERDDAWEARSCNWAVEGRVIQIVSVPRPENEIDEHLPHAEREIAGYLVEGLCYNEICARRGTKMRTVANQVAALFRRFKVSGRNELVCALLRKNAACYSSVPPAGSPVPPPPLPPLPPLVPVTPPVALLEIAAQQARLAMRDGSGGQPYR